MLKVFHYGPSFYSRIVRLALSESEVDFESVHVDVRQNIDPDFLQINPAGVVPTLVCPDGSVLKNTLDILKWIQQRHPEKWMVTDEHKSDHDALLAETLNFPVDYLTYASAQDANWLVRRQVTQSLRNRLADCEKRIRHAAERGDTTQANLYKERYKKNMRLMEALSDAKHLKELKQQAQSFILNLEQRIADNQGELWVFADRLTFADLAIFCLVYRFEELGYADFWRGSCPLVSDFLRRFKQRVSFEQTVQPYPFHLSTISALKQATPMLLLVAGAVALTVFVLRRLKH